MKRLLVLGFGLVVASHLPGQIFVPSNTPSTGTCNVFPFGQTSSKMQFLAPASSLGNPRVLTICDLAFAPCGSYNITFKSLEIRMAQTDATTLSATFATNMKTNVKTVLKATDYRWSVAANSWNTIGLDSSYLYLATGNDVNLVIEITLEGLSGGGSFHRDVLPRCWANGWTGSPPATGTSATGALKYEVITDRAHLNTFGEGCVGSNNQRPTLSFTGTGQFGTSMSIDLANAQATTPTLMSLNLSRNEPALDLGIIGAPTCKFYVTDLLVLGTVTDSSGAAAIKVGIPNSGPACIPVYVQYFPRDRGANNLGLTSSNYGRIVAGK